MSSQIDASKPTASLAYTADVRQNFQIAADEISALQAKSGVTDGSDAAPGEVGEYVVSANPTGAQLTTDIPGTIAQITLSPGCWELWGCVDFRPPANKSPNMICASISPNDGALPTDGDLYDGVGIMTLFYTTALTSGSRQVLMTGQCRANTSTSLTVYLVGETAFGGGGTSTALGYICARRVR